MEGFVTITLLQKEISLFSLKMKKLQVCM